ncbi:hypothetical protein AJ80_06902 [Polytolypa hystricis UAMH7299]|uniref:Xylanolytic transcriptional activator regulatory domain-containing protein n=1 Tax=Polytolypa hystricis (strain UAMH7299) TaxID=1447883 RepID=A0A2B7XTX1_POLH7|nr:hypothetical protein AJ80_06902 [Polytolypa hystricis UAMH7299]
MVALNGVDWLLKTADHHSIPLPLLFPTMVNQLGTSQVPISNIPREPSGVPSLPPISLGRLSSIAPATPGPIGPAAIRSDSLQQSSSLDFRADISAQSLRNIAELDAMTIVDHQPYFRWKDPYASNSDGQHHARGSLSDTVPNDLLQMWLEPQADRTSIDFSQTQFVHSATDSLFSIGRVHPFRVQTESRLQGSRWGVDEECKLHLQAVFSPVQQQHIGALSNHSSENLRTSPSNSLAASRSANSFPPAEILDMALDLYFRHFHPLMPFIHVPTFCARTTEPTVLFTMCLIGMVFLGTKGTTTFVLRDFPVSV